MRWCAPAAVLHVCNTVIIVIVLSLSVCVFVRFVVNQAQSSSFNVFISSAA